MPGAILERIGMWGRGKGDWISRRRGRKARRWWPWLKWTVVVAFGLLDVVIMLGLLFPIPFGGKWIMVLSGSMTPALEVGGVVLMLPIKAAAVEVGDILVFRVPGATDAIYAHRVIERRVQGNTFEFVTKGDANEEPDPLPVTAKEVVGKAYFHIPQAGYAIDEIKTLSRSYWGLGLLIGVPSILIIAGAIKDILSALDPQKVRQKRIEDRMKARSKSFKRTAA